MATSTSLSPQQAALPQMITLYHTLAAAQTSFISNIKTPLQADTTGFCEGGRETSPCDCMSYSPISFIYTGFICYSRLRQLRRCWQRRKVTVLCVDLRYEPLCVLWLFTLCWWIVALVIALYPWPGEILSALSLWCHLWCKFPLTTSQVLRGLSRMILMYMDPHPYVRFFECIFGFIWSFRCHPYRLLHSLLKG